MQQDRSWESESPSKEGRQSVKDSEPSLSLEIVVGEQERIHDKAWLVALAHLRKWRTVRINQLLSDILDFKKMTLEAFFEMSETDWGKNFGLDAQQCDDLLTAKDQLPLTSEIVSVLEKSGFWILPQTHSDYPKKLITNLGKSASPPVLYVDGDLSLLNQTSIALVGSRKASENALAFTEYIAQRGVKEGQVVVSGFAKGVDRRALDSTLDAGGKSIIVLPQGVMTRGSSLKKYEDAVSKGKVLILSAYHPKTPWRVGTAMRRNAFIYGLADDIYIAETGESGGTWSGAIDGLRKKRNIFVRQPTAHEKNANAKLIARGAIAVGYDGQLTQTKTPGQADLFENSSC